MHRHWISLLSVLALFASPLAAPNKALAQDHPASFADLVEKLSPAVVNISTTQKIKAAGMQIMPFQELPDTPEFEPFRQFFDRLSFTPGNGVGRAPMLEVGYERRAPHVGTANNENAHALQIALHLRNPRFGGDPERNFNPKGGTLALLTLDPKAAVQEFDKPLADCESKARAAKFARRRRLCLAKRLKQLGLILLGNTNAPVCDFKP